MHQKEHEEINESYGRRIKTKKAFAIKCVTNEHTVLAQAIACDDYKALEMGSMHTQKP